MIKSSFEKIDIRLMQKILFVTFLLLPILDLDYLFYDFLNQFNIPLPSTIFYFLWLPALIVLTYFVLEKKKRKVFLIGVVCGLICLGFFAGHHIIDRNLADVLYVTGDYIYSLAHELSYFITLMLPLFFVYVVIKVKPSEKWMNNLIIAFCLLISVPIFLSNIFEFGKSTYVGYVRDNIFSWFNGIYEIYHPRELCAKFFFPEGNTVGILMFALYPLLIKVFIQSKKKWWLLPLVIIHGISMFMLGTRVSTYGAMISIAVCLIITLALLIFKRQKSDMKAIASLVLILISFLLIYPYSPGKINQDLAYEDQLYHGMIDQSKIDEINSGLKDLIPGTEEYNQYYIDVFEQQELYRYMTFPDVYYTTVYPYKMDGKFYVDLITTVPFEYRKDGRDFEKYFFDYKWELLNPTQKLFGFSYSMFMNAGINLEQDFIVQKYQYGYLGFMITSLPWFILMGAIILKALFTLKKSFNMNVLIMGISSCSMLMAAYMSGHVADEFLTNMFLALLVGMLINNVYNKGEMK